MVLPRVGNPLHEVKPATISSFLKTNKCRKSLIRSHCTPGPQITHSRQYHKVTGYSKRVGAISPSTQCSKRVDSGIPYNGIFIGGASCLSSMSESALSITTEAENSHSIETPQLLDALQAPGMHQEFICEAFDSQQSNFRGETLVLFADAFGWFGERCLEEGRDPKEMGQRLSLVLQALGNRNLQIAQPHRFLCWSIQQQVFHGDIQGVPQLGKSIDYRTGSKTQYYSRLRSTTGQDTMITIHRILLLCRSRHFDDPFIAFDLILNHWALLRPYLRQKYVDADPSMARHGRAIFRIILDICATAPKELGETLLGGTRYSPKDSSRIASLYLLSISEACRSRESATFFRSMRLRKMKVDPPSWVATLDALVDANRLAEAHHLLHEFLPPKGIRAVSSPIIHDAALKIYAKQGNAELAQSTFDWISQTRRIESHHIIRVLQAWAIRGDTDALVRTFDRCFTSAEADGVSRRPDLAHFTIIMNAFAKKGDGESFKLWHARALETGSTFDTPMYNTILEYQATNLDIGSVWKTLDQMNSSGTKRDVATYTILIRFFGKRKDLLSAENLGRQAMEEGIIPDTAFVVALMDAHMESSSWEGVIRIVDYLQSHNHSSILYSTRTLNQLLKAYVQVGAPFLTVRKIFQKWKELGIPVDERSYCRIIQSACNAGQMSAALGLLDELEEKAIHPLNGIVLSARPLTAIMNGYLRLDQRSGAKAVFEEIVRRGLEPLAPACVHIMRAYGNINTRESLQVAEGFLNKVVEMAEGGSLRSGDYKSSLVDMVVLMMKAYSERGSPDIVEHYYSLLQSLGLGNDIRVLIQLMDTYRRSGDIAQVRQVWPKMLGLVEEERGSLAASSIIQINSKLPASPSLNLALTIYIDALSAAGCHDEIIDTWELLKKTGLSFDHHNWNYLAVAMVRAGHPERAFHIIENIIIPYQQKHLQRIQHRNLQPQSLFTSDDESTGCSESTEYHKINPIDNQTGKERSTAQSSQLPSSGEMYSFEDPALPIQLIGMNSRKTNRWTMHSATMNTLRNVVLRLSRGYLISPVNPGQEFQEALHDPVGATAVLHRIKEKFPRTMKVLSQMSGRHSRRRKGYQP